MAQLSMNETTTFRWSFEEDVAQYAAAGIPAIGVWRQKLSDCGSSKARDLLHQSGLKVSHLFWAGGFTGSDGRSYQESIEDAAEALRTAAELDCRTLVVYSGPRAGHTSSHARRLVAGALAQLAAEAGEWGVTLAVEPMHPGCADQWTFLTTLDDTLALLESRSQPPRENGARHVPSRPGERADGPAGHDRAPGGDCPTWRCPAAARRRAEPLLARPGSSAVGRDHEPP